MGRVAGSEGRVGVWQPRGDAGLRSAECSSLKEAPGLPGVSGCLWRLWEGGTWRGQTRGKSASETEGQGEVVVLKRWQGSEGTLGPRERKGSPGVTQGLSGRFRRGPRAPDSNLGQLCSDRCGGGLSPQTSGLSARPLEGLPLAWAGSWLCPVCFSELFRPGWRVGGGLVSNGEVWAQASVVVKCWGLDRQGRALHVLFGINERSMCVHSAFHSSPHPQEKA